MKARFRKSTVIAAITLLACGVGLTACSPAALSPNGVGPTSSSAPPTHSSKGCTTAMAAGFLAGFRADGVMDETRIAASSCGGPTSLPGLTAGLTPSCVFSGDGTQEAIFLGASVAIYQKLGANLVAAGFKKIQGDSTHGVYTDYAATGGLVTIVYAPNGSVFDDGVPAVMTPFVYVSR